MGRDRTELTVVAHLSRHNSDADVRDDALWDELRDRIELIVREHRYEPIDPHLR